MKEEETSVSMQRIKGQGCNIKCIVSYHSFTVSVPDSANRRPMVFDNDVCQRCLGC